MKLEERKRELSGAIEVGKRVILYVVENTESAQFRYRVKNVMESLESSKEWGAVWFLRSEVKEILETLSKVDLMVILRQTDKNGEMGRLITCAHEAGVKVLFDLDDLIFDYRDMPVLMRATNSRNVFYWVGYFWGVRRIARKVDGFICTNGFLASKLKRSFEKPVKVIPNSLNKEQVEISEQFVKKKKVREIAGGGFSIGYFSGSPTHVKDFVLAEPELVQFLERHDDAKLKIVGYMKLPRRIQKLRDLGRVELLGPVDYLRLQGLISKVDVNIAPLVINDFTNCKSELKFFEAAAVETTTIASPSYAFKNAIQNGVNGFLAKPGEWYRKLEFLYDNSERNKKIASVAKKDALDKYYGRKFSKIVEEAYEYFTK